MNKKVIAGAITSVVILLGALGSLSQTEPPTIDPHNNEAAVASTSTNTKPTIPKCDGTAITSNCVLDGVKYRTYVYHEAVPEKTHTEQVTTYEKKVTGYCTLCNDGTYSPSCATGRGACSHHGGVAEWNAPLYSSVPVYSNKTVVDAPVQAAYYEKVTD